MNDQGPLYYLRAILFAISVNLLVPKDRGVIVAKKGEGILKYDKELNNAKIFPKYSRIQIYGPDEKCIVAKNGQEVLIPADNQEGILVQKSYPIDSSSLIQCSEVEDKLKTWAIENDKNLEWKVGPRDMQLATYPESVIKEVMKSMPRPYFFDFKTPMTDYVEFSDCDDYAGVHFEYWIKRILPGCAYVIIEGYDPGGHEFGAIITREGNIMWINEVNPALYRIIAVTRY